MGKHISNSLYLCYHVMSSDEDLPVVMDIYVGFNGEDELTVSADFHDYEEPGNNCSTAVVVNSDDAREMARRNKVEYAALPRFVAECMWQWRTIINPSFSQVRACFKEITDCLLDEGCRTRIIRTYDRRGRCCW